MDSSEKTTKVFISYSANDQEVATRIADHLRSKEPNLIFEQWEMKSGDSISEKILNILSSCDILLVLLSPHSASARWVQDELGGTLLRQLNARAIPIIPVLLADCDIPDFISSRKYIDLRTDFEESLNELSSEIEALATIDFEKLNYRLFEQLSYDLLQELGFEVDVVDPSSEPGSDHGIDAVATFATTDPFGVAIQEKWLIQTKFYRKNRIDVSTIRELVGVLISQPSFDRALLITNGHVTSVSKEYIEKVAPASRTPIRLIDGTELSRLISQHPDLVKRYFESGSPV